MYYAPTISFNKYFPSRKGGLFFFFFQKVVNSAVAQLKPVNLWLWHLVLVLGSQYGLSKHRVLAGSSFLSSPCPAGFTCGFPAFLEAVLSAGQFCLVASLAAGGTSFFPSLMGVPWRASSWGAHPTVVEEQKSHECLWFTCPTSGVFFENIKN